VKPSKFEYHAPATADEAVRLLAKYGGDARALAGGQSLIPMMNFRLVAPAALIDLGRIADLAYIREQDGTIRIGAMTRQRALEFSPLVREKLPLVREALAVIGHLPTRSRGTIGGSIAHADPAAELPMVLCALDGSVVVRGPNGERTIAAADLFQTFFTTSLAPDEIIVEVRLPVAAPGAGCAVEEFARRKGDFAIAGIAALVARGGKTIRLAAAGTSPTPLRLRDAEQILETKGLGDAAIDEASAKAATLVNPSSDQNGSAEFRRHLTQVLTGRALRRALQAAR
jgi:aerobic carbon-monoxide dehydrogenase medium subunit